MIFTGAKPIPFGFLGKSKCKLKKMETCQILTTKIKSILKIFFYSGVIGKNN
jgi:hypothetical protein